MGVATCIPKATAIGVLASILLAGLSACQDVGPVVPGEVEVRVVIVGTRQDDPIWQAVCAGAARYSRETRKLTMEAALPASATPVAQRDALAKILVGQLPSVVCVLAIDGIILTHPISKLTTKGVHVILVGNDAPESQRRVFVGPDERAAGEAIGKTLVDMAGEHLTLMVLHDSERDRRSALRYEGLSDVLGRSKAIKVLRAYDCRGDRDKALQFLYKTSERYSDLGAWALLGDWLKGALPAGRPLIHGAAKIVGYGAGPGELDLVEDGRVYAVVDVDWQEIGYRAMQRAQQLLSLSVFPETDYLAPPIVVTRENVRDHRKTWRAVLDQAGKPGTRR